MFHFTLWDFVLFHFRSYKYIPRYVAYIGYKMAAPHLLMPLHWRHNGRDSVSNHQPHSCLLNRLFRRRSKKTWTFRVTGLCVGNSPGPVNSPHKGLVTRKMFPLDDVFMPASNTNYAADLSPWLHHRWIYNLNEAYLGSSPSALSPIIHPTQG